MTRSARILLVDDEVPIQKAVAPLLRSRGYEVEVAGTGGDALKMAAAHPPDHAACRTLPGSGPTRCRVTG